MQILEHVIYHEIFVAVEYLVKFTQNNEYSRKPVLIRRKQNVTGSVSFGQQIDFGFTIFHTSFVTLILSTISVIHLKERNW